jgi:hypothetical protein
MIVKQDKAAPEKPVLALLTAYNPRMLTKHSWPRIGCVIAIQNGDVIVLSSTGNKGKRTSIVLEYGFQCQWRRIKEDHIVLETDDKEEAISELALWSL